jgi:hypothetical protein
MRSARFAWYYIIVIAWVSGIPVEKKNIHKATWRQDVGRTFDEGVWGGDAYKAELMQRDP